MVVGSDRVKEFDIIKKYNGLNQDMVFTIQKCRSVRIGQEIER